MIAELYYTETTVNFVIYHVEKSDFLIMTKGRMQLIQFREIIVS